MTMTANPRALDGWLYPTYPPLTKGRNKTALLSGFPLVVRATVDAPCRITLR